MLSSATLQFLRDLKLNNNREWFHDNKKTYNAAKEDVIQFLAGLIEAVQEFDDSIRNLVPKQCMFRINRDIRFSKDKSPYKTNFSGVIGPNGRKSEQASFYVHIEPDNHFAGGGMWHPPTPHLKKVRQEIDYHTKDFVKVVQDPNFVKFFGTLQGDQLKTAPKGYPKDHPAIEYLRFKDFVAMRKLTDADAVSSNYVTTVAETFQTVKPLNDFLNRAIS